jgi:hypothetical protein
MNAARYSVVIQWSEEDQAYLARTRIAGMYYPR